MASEWLRRARKEGAPLIEDERVTFVWHGKEAPQLVGDFNGWGWTPQGGPGSGTAEMRGAEPRVWVHTRSFQRDAYMEYAYLLHGERMLDPFNPRTTPNGVGQRNNFFYMPEAAPTALMRRRRNVPAGEVTGYRIELQEMGTGKERRVFLYQPPVPQPCPLVAVWDGLDYLRRARLPTILDNLIAEQRIRPVAVALIENAGANRVTEYAENEMTLRLLLERVLPLARSRLNLLDPVSAPGSYGVAGASMGGLMALYTGLRLPHIFGRVLSQSGAFNLSGMDTVSFDLVRDGPVRPIRIYMDVGQYEWLLEVNRRMYRLLAGRGYRVQYREFHAGHNYPAWRNDLGRGFEWLYPPE